MLSSFKLKMRDNLVNYFNLTTHKVHTPKFPYFPSSLSQPIPTLFTFILSTYIHQISSFIQVFWYSHWGKCKKLYYYYYTID